jgi:hypothetical protein
VIARFSASAFSSDARVLVLASTFFKSRLTIASNSPILRCFCANGPQQGGLFVFRGIVYDLYQIFRLQWVRQAVPPASYDDSDSLSVLSRCPTDPGMPE